MMTISYPKLDEGLRLKRLSPPAGRVRMVLDTDAFNEVDDQFALAYALQSPEKLDLLAVTAAPFFNWNSTSPGEGMEKSYHEIFKIYNLMGHKNPPPVFRGSNRYMGAADNPVDSEGARRIIELALASEEDDPLYVTAIGAITNVASAIALCPEIISRMVLVWLGPNAYWWENHRIFNCSQDYGASSVIYDSGVPLVLLPCHSVASHLLTTPYEIDACLRGKNPLCDYFSELFHGRHERFGENKPGWSKVLWDVSTIAWLLNPEWVPSKLIPTPRLTPDFTYDFSENRPPYREAVFIDRSKVYMDMFAKLSAIEQTPEAAK
jgi:inosine-uridine nucleoside N-ribohydrolase